MVFLTGSRRWNVHTDSSDLDLLFLVSANSFIDETYSDQMSKIGRKMSDYPKCTGFTTFRDTICDININGICALDEIEYDAWKYATLKMDEINSLLISAKVDRVAMFEQYKAEYKKEYNSFSSI